MNAAEIKTLIDETLAALIAARDGLSPELLEASEKLAKVVLDRSMVQQSLRLMLGMDPVEVVKAADASLLLTLAAQKAVKDKTIDKWIAVLQKLKASSTQQWLLDLFI